MHVSTLSKSSHDNSYLGLEMVLVLASCFEKKEKKRGVTTAANEFHQQYAKVRTSRYVLLLTLNKALPGGSPRIDRVSLMVRVKFSLNKF